MKKSFQKILSAIKKIRPAKHPIRKLRFSGYQEDFVITEQEEREGGFFGSLNFKMLSQLE